MPASAGLVAVEVPVHGAGGKQYQAIRYKRPSEIAASAAAGQPWAQRYLARAKSSAGAAARGVIKDPKAIAQGLIKGAKGGGASLRPFGAPGGTAPKTLTVVSRHPDEDRGYQIDFRDASLTKKDVREKLIGWIKAQAGFVKADKNRVLGSWVAPDKSGKKQVYFDVGDRMPRAQAVKEGKARNQIGVFDLEKGEYIPTGGTGQKSAPSGNTEGRKRR